ncbi:MAG: type II toxin-antitoxin system VapC family toxin [Oscillospiraceae bacterium]|jgi:predicted nucleic acid-binding protein|nr:type II toxin-antitoxin system VapC family toxin [Oscillospiraceae bacterium]
METLGKILFDTCIVIDIFSYKYSFSIFQNVLHPVEKCISIISEIEFYSFPSITPHDEEKIHTIISGFVIYPLDQDVKNATISIRKSSSLKLPDSIIVATAIVHKALLVTNDLKILSLKYQGLKIVSPVDFFKIMIDRQKPPIFRIADFNPS